MRPYRMVSSVESEIANPPQRRGRAVAIVIGSIAVHVAVLATAFVMRAPEPVAPKTEVVPVLAGHVDPMTGDFQATGLRGARIAKK
jgi:hypothetical protein